MIKVFKTKDYEEANKFIDTVDVKEGGVMFTDEHIIVNYDEKNNYNKKYLERIIEGVKRNRFHSEIQVDSREIEFALAQEKYKKAPNDKAVERLYEEKRNALETAKENIIVADKQIKKYEGRLKELN